MLSTGISDCFQVQPRILADERGRFVKVFHNEAFIELGLKTYFIEEYYSCSRFRVVRGLQFQSPPVDHIKIIYCVEGEVLDVVPYIRVDSPSYGFYVKSEKTTLVYKVSSVHCPQHDNGILWSSANINWPNNKPLLSDRDLSLLRRDSLSIHFNINQRVFLIGWHE
jgi:dTDP-4-dehydrorhamnose 3,5-epimerase